ncbi:transcription-repair coupling factor [Chthonobacter rhizosphaerae]|uniref:transcription-repair coupling factor n=1 Tax=Chthonobacter rhizosphaerae TaxID=2735553 RepID=UPI0015EE92C5|nr:transcription-repair coupling factor [Chthonobacter rhizosphaerae]
MPRSDQKPLDAHLFDEYRAVTVAGVPDGAEAYALAEIARSGPAKGVRAVYVARDGQRLAQLQRALAFFAPEIGILEFPAWDCLPYDRVSPTPAIVARRMTTLAALVASRDEARPFVLLTTVNALVQKVVPPSLVSGAVLAAAPGNRIDMGTLTAWLEDNGFSRTSTVRDTGEYAVRGGILDLFAPGAEYPVRLDFFGDTLESIRTFDPESQRTVGQLIRLDLVPMSEVQLTPASIKRFRQGYVAAFGAATSGDPLYEAVSEGRRYAGVEHWMPLFHESVATLFDYVPDAPYVLDPLADEAVTERLVTVADHFDARIQALKDGGAGAPYKPLPPGALYLLEREVKAALDSRDVARLTPFHRPEQSSAKIVDLGGKTGRSFAAERASPDANVFDVLVQHIRALKAENRRVVLACWSEGSRDRLAQVIADHGVQQTDTVPHLAAALKSPAHVLPLAILGVETGFELPEVVVVAEQDVLGDRLIRGANRRKRADNFLKEVAALAEGDLVVHVDHGIGRFMGLKTIEAAGAPHDCLEIQYAGGDRLFLPVENIELLSRYGSEDTEAQLDKLGGGAWQARKAKMKKRIREMADELIKTAAARMLRTAPSLIPPEGVYDEFAARFPYDETDDQLNAIDSVMGDLGSGRPMDRLVCGDVGFGKTEVALRAAFLAAMSGKQVAVVVPTTLLSRQHFRTFEARFRGLPIEVRQASRLVPAKELAATRAGIADGTVDIVVGTHALLAKGITFKDLGLLIIDEEQHFGVKHKERLKELKADVHVLTLSATPIPRTLQLALTGVRELSLIATPPVDRLAVRTFITPFDPLVIREALLREKYRGGQAFYVCPRLSDLASQREFLEKHVPEVKVAVAHGQMAATDLEDIMNAFYEGQYDVLLSTTIVESGLDIPTANTLVVHRADMFGLAQLYQLKGRVGRSKTRAYALFTTPAEKKLTAQAERRLKVLQSLDTLGAGFQLASHDLDIRGAGNLLGEEQSGHIKEVGYELYQQMLEEAVAALKTGDESLSEDQWSPQITVGTPVMIPDHYVNDLTLRLGLYRRLADLEDASSIDAFGAELIDRFGPLPTEVEHLLKIVTIKALCRKTNVDKIDAGPKGVVISFREGRFDNPPALVKYIGEQGIMAKIRPDQKIVLVRDWPDPEQRLKGTAAILVRLAKMVDEAKSGAPTKLTMPVTPPPPPPEPVRKGSYPSVASFKAKGRGTKGGSGFGRR